MARNNYSAGKRQRERDKARKKKEKSQRRRDNRGSGGGIPIATADEIQGGLLTIEEVMAKHSGEKQEETRANAIPSRLFVGGLSWRLTSDDLRKKLEEFGAVNDAFVVADRETGDSRGFGFVTMADRKDAARAIRQLNGQEFAGRTLVVRQATERQR